MANDEASHTVMRCVRGNGLSIEDARGLRVDVHDCALRVHRPNQAPEVVGTVGSLTSAIWLNPVQTSKIVERRGIPFAPLSWGPRGSLNEALRQWGGGSVVVSGPDGVALTVPIDAFTPWGGDQRHKRDASGATGLARALGLVLEAADGAHLPARRDARAHLVEPQQRAGIVQRATWALTALAGVLAFLSLPYGESWVGPVLSLAALPAIAPALLVLVNCRRRFEELVGDPTDTDDRSVYPLPETTTGRLNAQLQFGDRDVVLVDGAGGESWLPGPAVGGVVSCVIGETTTALLDARGAPLLVMMTAQVVADDHTRGALSEAAAAAGITVASDPLYDVGTDWGTPLDLVQLANEPGLWMSEWERGRISISVDVLVPLAGALHLAGAVIVLGTYPLWGALAITGSVAWLGIRAWAGSRYRRWRTRVRRGAQSIAQPGVQH